MSSLTIALDTMSGDLGPCVSVPAALHVLQSNSSIEMLLVGESDKIQPFLLKAHPNLLSRITIIPSKSVIANDIKPSQAIRHSKDSSMRIALELVESGKAQACVSAGNTGALMGLAKMMLKPLDGIERPALVTAIPNQMQGKTLVLDLGANAECNSNMLVQFAIMGSIMAKEVFNIPTPRVSLLNIGEEEVKGLDNIRKAAATLKTLSEINYQGYLEADQLLTGKTDVLVCDGFVGNVALKTVEGMVKFFLSLLKSSDHRSFIMSLISKWLQRHLIKRFAHFDPDLYNGAFLLGLRAIVIKSHGAANQKAFTVAINQAVIAVEKKIPTAIASGLLTMLSKDEHFDVYENISNRKLSSEKN